MHRTLRLSLVSSSALLAACAWESPTVAAPALKLKETVSATAGTVRFTVAPGSQTTAVIGEHKIVFDKEAICNPLTSSYGPRTWDAPCEPVGHDIQITATYWTALDGSHQIDFQPALRFNPKSMVVLHMTDKRFSADAADRILFVDALGQRVDEAASDPSLATTIGTNGFRYRRIKHFSGYTLSTGRSDTTSDGF